MRSPRRRPSPAHPLPPRPTPARRGRGASRLAAAGPEERLRALVDAAVRVFRAKSYRRAQMADVARELGVSPGNLYNYVESKEALFHLVVERGFGVGGGDAAGLALPIPTPPPGATLALLESRLARESRLASLDAALARKRVADPRAELEAIVREHYHLIGRYREGIALLERSAHDWPELAALFYAGMRRDLLRRLERWLASRMDAGLLRRVPDVPAAARFLNESIAWFALHRAGDKDSKDLDDAACEETVVDLLVHAFAKE